MLAFSDERWEGLKGGYHEPFDPRPLLANLETGKDIEKTWRSLWDELHHQGGVDVASYAVVPHLVRIACQQETRDWNFYGMVGIIEVARGQGKNPPLPSWLDDEYFKAIQDLAALGLRQLHCTGDAAEVGAILGVVAISRGARTYGRFLLMYSEDELLEFESAGQS